MLALHVLRCPLFFRFSIPCAFFVVAVVVVMLSLAFFYFAYFIWKWQKRCYNSIYHGHDSIWQQHPQRPWNSRTKQYKETASTRRPTNVPDRIVECIKTSTTLTFSVSLFIDKQFASMQHNVGVYEPEQCKEQAEATTKKEKKRRKISTTTKERIEPQRNEQTFFLPKRQYLFIYCCPIKYVFSEIMHFMFGQSEFCIQFHLERWMNHDRERERVNTEQSHFLWQFFVA